MTRRQFLLLSATLPALWPNRGWGAGVTVEAPAGVDLGQPFLVRVWSPTPLAEPRLAWREHQLPLTSLRHEDRWLALALLGSDVLEAKPGAAEVVLTWREAGQLRSLGQRVALTEREYPEQRLTLPEKMVTPPAALQARLERERAVVRQVLAQVAPERRWRLPLVRPVSGEISSVYGLRRVLNGQPKAPHRGLDFRAAPATPVAAVADGVVALVADHYYAGTCVYVDHGLGLVSSYFHLSVARARAGQRLRAGDMVGLTGASGRATGPHLHFGLHAQAAAVDPWPLFSAPATP